MTTCRQSLGSPRQALPFLVATALLVAFAGGSSAVAAPIKVACIGDNNTHSDLFSNNRETQPPGMQEYPRKLQDLMGTGYDVRNFGDCCASVIGGYPRSETHPYVSGSNYNNAVAFAPDIVIIGPWGRHDWGKSAMTALAAFSVPAFQTGYEDIINRFEALPSKPKIWVTTLIPLPFGMDGPDGARNIKTSPESDVVTALAAKHNLPVIDLFTAFLGQPTLFIQPPKPDSDGEHTSDAGSTKFAQMVAAALMGQGGGGFTPPPADGGVVSGAGGSGGSGGRAGGTGGAAATSTGGAGLPAGTGGSSSFGSGGVTFASTGGSTSSGSGGSAANAADSGSSGGCACSLASSDGRGRSGIVLLLTAGSVLVVRRRNRRRSRNP